MTTEELCDLRRMSRIGTLLSDATVRRLVEEACLLAERVAQLQAELRLQGRAQTHDVSACVQVQP